MINPFQPHPNQGLSHHGSAPHQPTGVAPASCRRVARRGGGCPHLGLGQGHQGVGQVKAVAPQGGGAPGADGWAGVGRMPPPVAPAPPPAAQRRPGGGHQGGESLASGHQCRVHGVGGPLVVGGRTWRLEMPPLPILDDEQIASTLTYLRREWEHNASPVSPADVAKVRAANAKRTKAWTTEELKPAPVAKK